MENDNQDKVEDSNFVLDPISYKDLLKASITLYNLFLQI